MESQVSEVVRALYGGPALIERGVVHVSAVMRADDGGLRVLKIGSDSPKSATDFFILNLCRARADAILTTAENLRAEPHLRHALQGPSAGALAAYRHDVLAKPAPPTCAIMTRSGVLPHEHPVWQDGTPKLVLTGEGAHAQLSLGQLAEVVAVVALDARRACDVLHTRGHELVSIEAGPSTASVLYDEPSVVDELLLSTYEGSRRDVALGGRLPAGLLAGRTLVGESVREEESGQWRFQRWLRG